MTLARRVSLVAAAAQGGRDAGAAGAPHRSAARLMRFMAPSEAPPPPHPSLPAESPAGSAFDSDWSRANAVALTEVSPELCVSERVLCSPDT